MQLTIVALVLAALIVAGVAGFVIRRRRATRPQPPTFDDLSREDQVQVMRAKQGGDATRGANESSRHIGGNSGPGHNGGPW